MTLRVSPAYCFVGGLRFRRPQIEFQRIKAEQRLVNNTWVKKARLEAGKEDKIAEYRGKLTGEHKVGG